MSDYSTLRSMSEDELNAWQLRLAPMMKNSLPDRTRDNNFVNEMVGKVISESGVDIGLPNVLYEVGVDQRGNLDITATPLADAHIFLKDAQP